MQHTFTENLRPRGPATVELIAAFQKAAGTQLPEAYLAFLLSANGGEGFAGKAAYAMLWGVDELIAMNKGYEVERYAPGLLLIGSDGGGEAYGFDTRIDKWPVVRVPFVGMSWSLALPVAPSFSEFFNCLRRIG